MKRKKILVTFAQLSFVAITALGFYVYNQNATKPVEVFTFNREMTANTEIQLEDLNKTTIPKEATKKQEFIKSANEVVGKAVNTRVYPNEFVVKTKITNKEDVDPFESMDLSKYRKISLPINFVEGLSGNLKRGDKVDLVYVGEGKKKVSDGETDFKYSKTFLQDVLVYNVNTDEGFKFRDKSEGIKGENGGDMQKDADVSTGGEDGRLASITLAVPLNQAEEVMVRAKTGQVRVLGRFKESQDQQPSGYIIGDYSNIFSGSGLAETNK